MVEEELSRMGERLGESLREREVASSARSGLGDLWKKEPRAGTVGIL